MKKIKVIELFAGVGGFRLGLEDASNKDLKYDVVWSNQWEPGATTQHASEIYEINFGPKGHSNKDIQQVIEKEFDSIPDHDMLVWGFPCQDYSVASTLSNAKWIVGKKGVLWWSIYNIVKGKWNKAPDILMLENVDRLLKSPATQRGRDFAIMLKSLSELGYIVEWRVINAADYGMPQRRRRVFILAYKEWTKIYKQIMKEKNVGKWIQKTGVIAQAFPTKKEWWDIQTLVLKWSLESITKNFAKDEPKKSFFETAWIIIGETIYTTKVQPDYKWKYKTLEDCLIKNEEKVPPEFYINPKDKKMWELLKWAKKQKRITKSGFEYDYSEGGMIFPDPINKPSRTIVTGEWGSSPSRFKHVIERAPWKLRRLLPEELEKLNMFPPGHTEKMKNGKIVPDSKRAFIMWNALVIGIVEELGKSLSKFIS